MIGRSAASVQATFSHAPISGRMAIRAFIVAFALVLVSPVGPVAAAEPQPRACFDRFAQRSAVLGGQAMPLTMALRSLHPHDGDALLRARLCSGPGSLVYLVTLLSRTGRVTSVTIDARNGTIISGH
jgi:hypothetical protein